MGIIITIGLTAVFIRFVFHQSWATALIIGAVMSPTDSAAVFSVLRKVPIPARVRSILEGESGLNDAPTVLLVIAFTEYAAGHLPSGGWLAMSGLILVELAGGIASDRFGVAVGRDDL